MHEYWNQPLKTFDYKFKKQIIDLVLCFFLFLHRMCENGETQQL